MAGKRSSGANSPRGGRGPVRDGQRQAAGEPMQLRIIGGTMRGRPLLAPHDPRTRPMKDRLREAVFNLLGGAVREAHAIDLFAGSGALGLEALSRGAARATLIERHFPTAALIRRNVQQLGVESRAEVVAADAFIWVRQKLAAAGPEHWVVFCSPPYDFYVERRADMLRLLDELLAAAPPRSVLVVESDQRFDTGLLPSRLDWDVREYGQGVVALAVVGPR
ncbi:MAG: 16S rRNA (guanine(966)-N(2))-methyltransferase RsmD [Pirellulaceae bacterium]|nr:16S rRNA (guanine(966)-N(2))-methyltransferase RsmD [Pirellulaceae bacterium]